MRTRNTGTQVQSRGVPVHGMDAHDIHAQPVRPSGTGERHDGRHCAAGFRGRAGRAPGGDPPRKRPVVVALSLVVAVVLAGRMLAHGGDDDVPSTLPAPAPTGGSVHVRVEQQFALGILTEPIDTRTLANALRATGRIVPRTDAVADVMPPIAGRVVGSALPRLGDHVRRGQVLFRIAQVLTPAEQTAIRTELIRAKSELALRERESQRLDRLEGVVASRETAEAHIRLEAARGQVAALDAQLSGKGATVPVTAPISGVITAAEVVAGESVEGSHLAYRIADLSSVWVEADFFERDLPLVRSPGRVQVRVPSLPGQTFTATLHSMGSGMDSTTRTLQALFVLANPGERLKLNMSAVVIVASDTGITAPAVPRTAIVRSGSRALVFVHTLPEEFQVRDVTVGTRGDADYAEIVSGLQAGDRVVTVGNYQLKSMAGL
ncbi:MAG TPA: efflux RND transporter periplasmic adaptor subunit [Candidatus Kapabacteria bacterium]|nr:efflux RND transporter periplasmic adaptor subunit [Candidatus Kapabacteria bacterium]